MTLSETIRSRIADRLADTRLRSVIQEEMQQILADRPDDIPHEPYCTTVALLILRELGCRIFGKQQDVTEDVAPGHRDDDENFETIISGLLAAMQYDLIGSNMQMVKALGSAVAERDTGTNEHSHKVTLYTVRLAEKLGIESDDMRTIIKGSLLHDIGKIGTPDATLLKQGKLTQEEFLQMKEHAVRGEKIIRGVLWLEDAAAIVRHHHERWDGDGYPDKLAGEAIPLGARIFAVADVFDALTSDRPYKEAISCDDTLEFMRGERGKHFDPHIFDTFLPMAPDLFQEYAHQSPGELDQRLIQNIETYFGLDPKGRYLNSLFERP